LYYRGITPLLQRYCFLYFPVEYFPVQVTLVQVPMHVDTLPVMRIQEDHELKYHAVAAASAFPVLRKE
jgi:hypothetical protein